MTITHDKNAKVLLWTTISPDIKAIEHRWGILERKVEEKSPQKHS